MRQDKEPELVSELEVEPEPEDGSVTGIMAAWAAAMSVVSVVL